MKRDIRIKKHFGLKKVHTEIKHEIFKTTITTSLSIANHLSRVGDTYTYIDLYSGKGSFEDGSIGSPLIAIDSALSIIRSSPSHLRFSKIRCVLIDRDEENIRSLQESIKSSVTDGEKLEVCAGVGEWETFSAEIEEYLSESTWGFIFADPFSTELDINKLKNLISRLCGFKDILVFVNFNTLARQHGRKLETDIARVCSTLGITPDDMKRPFNETFRSAVQTTFSGFGKDFIVSVAFPVAVEGKLTNSNYFYLILSTSSTGVADAFLEEYSENVMRHRGELPPEPLSLFQPPTDPCEHILSILRKRGEITFYFLLLDLYNDFFSWKNPDTDKIPTSKNLQRDINTLSIDGKISVTAPSECLYKADQKKIKLDIFKRKGYLVKGKIRLK